MKRVLFVDDDPDILNGLRRALRRERLRWDMVFVPGPELALERLDAEQFDVIVSDLHMAPITGIELLVKAAERHPGIVCLMLSGSADLRAADEVATCVLSKPCDPETLCTAITTSLAKEQL
jgi:DNA-binding NtrC family response regulator